MLRLLASALLFGAAVRAMITLDEAVAFMKGTDALNGTETAAVTGQYLALDGFDAAFITNASHLLVAINMTHALDDCGYAAIGFGTSMSDSAMAIMFYDDEVDLWELQMRLGVGHTQPQSTTLFDDDGIAIVDSLSDSSATAVDYEETGHTVVSFVRPLTVSTDAQDVSEAETQMANFQLAVEGGQDVVWAFSARKPEKSDDGNATVISKHDGSQFGYTQVNLAATLDDSASAPDWTSYDTVIAIHAFFALLTWLIVSPLAVLLGRYGRKWSRWFTWHYRLQMFWTLPATLIVVAMGLVAMSLGSAEDGIDWHKGAGLAFGVLIVLQAGIGYWSHRKFSEGRVTRPWHNATHIVLGLVLLVLAWLQIRTGFDEYTGREIPVWVIRAYYALVLVFVILFLGSGIWLVYQRRKAGYSWRSSVFGLGRNLADKQTSIKAGERGGVHNWHGLRTFAQNDAQEAPIEAPAAPTTATTAATAIGGNAAANESSFTLASKRSSFESARYGAKESIDAQSVGARSIDAQGIGAPDADYTAQWREGSK